MSGLAGPLLHFLVVYRTYMCGGEPQTATHAIRKIVPKRGSTPLCQFSRQCILFVRQSVKYDFASHYLVPFLNSLLPGRNLVGESEQKWRHFVGLTSATPSLLLISGEPLFDCHRDILLSISFIPKTAKNGPIFLMGIPILHQGYYHFIWEAWEFIPLGWTAKYSPQE